MATVTPYLFFEGRCEEALNFYKQALGAETGVLMRYKDCPDQSSGPPANPNAVMHAAFKVLGETIMASDGHAKGSPKFEGFGIAITPADEGDAKRKFEALAQGGGVLQPLVKTFFAKSFGMVRDKFGVMWMLMVEA